MTSFLTSSDLADNLFIEEKRTQIEQQTGCRCLIDEPLSKHTSWRVGGPARLYAFPRSAESVASLIQFCVAERIQIFTIGYGTNLLASDEGFPGCVIDLADGLRDISVKGETIVTGGGAWLGEVVRISAENGLAGMEKLAGIPGGIGGGMSMNAGAFGMSISDHLVTVTAIDNHGNLNVLSKSDVGFGYRAAPGLVGKSIVSAEFNLIKKRKNQVVKAVEETVTDRFRRNVMTLPSAGSVFKNPVGGFAARMVEAVGGKGMKEGGVEVSMLHANFIVNMGGGCAADILRLIERIRTLVQDHFGVRLELEVRTLGFDADVRS